MIGWRPAVGMGAAEERGPGEGDPLPPFAPAQARSTTAVRELPLLLALAILIAFLFKTFVAQAFYIPSGSMIPQLDIGDRVVVSKVAYHLHSPRRGDIVVFDCPPKASPACPVHSSGGPVPVRWLRSLFEAIGLRQPSTEEYIKRVVGLSGELVQGRNGKVFVNKRELVEPYLPPGTVTTDFGPIIVPPGELWVMGDNRTESSDSRVFGPIRRSTLVGRAIIRAWPFGRLAFL